MRASASSSVANTSGGSRVRGGLMRPQAFLSSLGLPGAGSKPQQRQERKQQLLDLIGPLQRGAAASDEDKAAVEAAARRLEQIDPTPKPLESPLLNGRWKLVYTTSDSILGTKRPPFLRPTGPIYQLLDGPQLRAQNRETAPFFNSVTADLTPVSSRKVKVQFRQFKVLNLLPVNAPDTARGELTVTYLDEEMRISRGDKGNLFVLLQDDSDDRPQ